MEMFFWIAGSYFTEALTGQYYAFKGPYYLGLYLKEKLG